MARLFGDRDIPTRFRDLPTSLRDVPTNLWDNIPTGLLVGAPLLIAGTAATIAFYRRSDGGRASHALRRGQRRVRDVMTQHPACCRPDTSLREVAEMMVASDCGEIPVCDDARNPIGVVTDRDIVCRLLAKGHDPLHATTRDCMSRPVITCTPEMSVDECARLMQRHQIRRVPIVDRNGTLVGMVSQADLARRGPQPVAAETLEQVSEPNVFASAVGGR